MPEPPFHFTLVPNLPAVHVERLPRDVAGIFGRKERVGVRELLREARERAIKVVGDLQIDVPIGDSDETSEP